MSQHWKHRHEYDPNRGPSDEGAQAAADRRRARFNVQPRRRWNPVTCDHWELLLRAALPTASFERYDHSIVAVVPGADGVARRINVRSGDKGWTWQFSSAARDAAGELLERGPSGWADNPADMLSVIRAALALQGGTQTADPAPIEALGVDGWDPADCYWNSKAGEWTRPPLPEALI